MIRAGLCFLMMAMMAASALAQDQPRPKSQREAIDINACVGATDVNTRLDMCENFLNAHPRSDYREMAFWLACTSAPNVPDGGIQYCQKLIIEFKNTEHKENALYLTMLGYQQSNDFEGLLTYGELVLDENPEHWGALLALSYVIPLRTRQHDLDKDEKLSQAEGYAKRALDVVPRAENPNTEAITDDEWLLQKKDLGPHAAHILFISAPNSGIDALVQRSRVPGIVSGTLAGHCHLKYVQHGSDVQVGDVIIASGLDGIFPKGQQIGRVLRVATRDDEMFQDIEVVLSAELAKIEEVLVVAPAVVRAGAEQLGGG